MPSSPNRRRLEIPTALYTRLESEAQCRQVTAAALANTLLVDALGRVERGVNERGAVQDALHQLLDGNARQTAELQAIRRELAQTLPRIQATGLAPVAPLADLARTFGPQDWAELLMTGQGAHGRTKGFEEVLAGSPLPPALREYTRLLLVSALTQSESLRAEYLRQAEALRARLATVPLEE